MNWKYYHQLRPDQLEMIVKEKPIAFWPLGLIEHHGWHLPIGFDGLKAEQICIRIAKKTGGVILPTMWWGALGGHGDFKWTHYQDPTATTYILIATVEQLISFEFQVIVLMAGHYPWQSILDQQLQNLKTAYPHIHFWGGTETSICGTAVKINGDHAGKEETSYGLAMFPEFVDLSALRDGRDETVWPKGVAPDLEKRHRWVEFDPNKPMFAQMGEPADTATANHGERALQKVVEYLADQINQQVFE